MAGLLFSGAFVRHGVLGGLPLALKGPLQYDEQLHLQRATSAFVMAAVCDGLPPPAGLSLGGGALGTVLSVSTPPRTHYLTRRLIVPAYCLAGTRTRRRGKRLGGGDDDDLFGGGGDDGWGGGEGNGGGGGGDNEEGSDDGSIAARLQDLLLLWSVFCTLAFAQTLYHVSPKPKTHPVFAALGPTLSYTALKARLGSQSR